MDMKGALFSSDKDHWATPVGLYAALHAEFQFTLDPCPLYAGFDGLVMPWPGRVFVNPPYSDVARWVAKARAEVEDGNAELVVLLVFARTDTRWFHEHLWNRAELRFVRGRLKFGDGKGRAPAPSLIAVLRP